MTTTLMEIKRGLRGTARENEPLAPHTTWGIGGPAALWAEPVDRDDLRQLVRSCAAMGVPFFVMGAGSNVLINDAGFPGVVVSLCRLAQVRLSGTRVAAGAGLSLRTLVRETMTAGLSGLECVCGVPGTVGGALATNAGAKGRAISDTVETIDILAADGVITAQPRAACTFGYRVSSVKKAGVVCAAEFQLDPREAAAIKQTLRMSMRERKAKQPSAARTAGSVFKNPVNDAAGRLIEASGCKGWTEGGAVVSEKHANFIVNRGRARAQDVRTLMERVRAQVARVTGVELEPEVELVG
jgi:UDP-N-acetylmuramate dehydrogenase